MSAKARILIADDSRIVRAKIAQHIRDRFDVREVTDGESAWQAILLDSSIRVVITDLTMPKIDGFELLARVRSSRLRRIRELPMIVISGADEQDECQRAADLGATDFIQKGVNAAELISRLEVVMKLSSARESQLGGRAAVESSPAVDPDTELLNLAYFDHQVEKLISFSRRNVTDVAVICLRVELSLPQSEAWEGDIENRTRMVARALASSIRMEDHATRSERYEFCVATQSEGVASVLRFAARLRKVLENADSAGAGVEVWTSIGIACLSEDMHLAAEQLRQISQRRAQQAQSGRSRRIVLGASDLGAGKGEIYADQTGMDLNLALTLIRSGRAPEVIPHLPRLIHQLRPLMALVRQQKELELANKETEVHGSLQGVPRPIDQRP